MERKRRRLFTIAVSAGAVLVILAAAASSLFQLAVQAVPGYRADVERYVRQVTGRDIRIGSLGLTWHYYYPSLELVDVALLGADGKAVLEAERLRLGFGLHRLLSADLRPDRLELHGLALDVRIGRDGQVAVKGIEAADTPGAAEPVDALEPLTQFATLRLERCRLNLRDERRGGELYSFGVEDAELSRGLLGSDLEADVALPASVGETAHLEVSFTGETLDPLKWSGGGELELSGLSPSFWLGPYLARGASLSASHVKLSADGRFDAGHFTRLDLRARSGPVRAERAGHSAGFDGLDARVGVEFLPDGWRAQLKKFALDSALGGWPATGGELRATQQPGLPTSYEGRADYLRLADLAPWLQVVQVPERLAAFSGAAGDVRDLQFHAQADGEAWRYGYRARFEQLALPAQGRPAGFSGARGEVAGDEHGGRVLLAEGPLNLALPGVLSTPTVPFDSLEAELEWRRQPDGWRLALPQFRWATMGTHGQGHLDLTLPDVPGASPLMNLGANFSASDVTRAKPLMPQAWGEGLRAWLDRAILSGNATEAKLEIHGPLADFPYDTKTSGSWTLDIDARNLNLAYQPDWPSVENFAAKLHFTGNSLAIEAQGGSVSGAGIQSASARFPDFATGQLLVDGAVAGETGQFYDFLRHSPLKDLFAGLLASTSAGGPSTVEIHLDIPVLHAQDTQTSGKVTLAGVQLQYQGLDEPIREIRGVVEFAPNRITGEHLTGKLYELPIEARLQPRPDGSSLLLAEFPCTLDASGKGASQLVPAWVRKHTAGTTQWRAQLPIGSAAGGTLTLSTDLVGVEVRLPAPLGKPAAQAVPLMLAIGGTAEAPLHITADYQGRLGADLRFAHAGGKLAFDRGALRIGNGQVPEAREKGMVLGGQLDDVDARAWIGELEGAGSEGQFVRSADLHVNRTHWGRYVLRDARWQWALAKDGWTLDVVGAGGSGELRWSSRDKGTLMARMDAMAFEAVPADATDSDDSVFDPNAAPVLDLDIKKLTVGSADLGHVTFLTERAPAGQKIRTLHAEGGSLDLGADGEWRRRAGQSSASLHAELVSKDMAGLLKAFGYSPTLDAKKAHFKAALAWAPADRVEWAQAQGTVNVDSETGQLRAVEPGAGRVLGLVNLYALPRRLTLNFRDVVSSGLGFDKLTGDFDLRDGSANTQNLDIDGPSLRMEVRGRIGLAARDYDQQVKVYPDVSSGVTLGALALGGPVAGALTFIAQKILNKPLSQVTELSYRVTGSWDNPQVERGSAPPTAAKAPEAKKP